MQIKEARENQFLGMYTKAQLLYQNSLNLLQKEINSQMDPQLNMELRQIKDEIEIEIQQNKELCYIIKHARPFQS